MKINKQSPTWIQYGYPNPRIMNNLPSQFAQDCHTQWHVKQTCIYALQRIWFNILLWIAPAALARPFGVRPHVLLRTQYWFITATNSAERLGRSYSMYLCAPGAEQRRCRPKLYSCLMFVNPTHCQSIVDSNIVT